MRRRVYLPLGAVSLPLVEEFAEVRGGDAAAAAVTAARIMGRG